MKAEDEPLEVIRVCGPTEAEMIQEILSNNGIDCTLQGEAAALLYPATGNLDDVRLWVNPQDAERARELIDEFLTPVENS